MTLRTRLTALVAALTIVAIVIALPSPPRLAVGANPIPDTWPTLDQVRAALTSPDDGTLALGALTVLGWAAWLFLAGSIALEILARARGVRAPRLPGPARAPGGCSGLVGAAILLFVAAPVTGTPAKAATIAMTHAGVAAAVEIPAGAHAESSGTPQDGRPAHAGHGAPQRRGHPVHDRGATRQCPAVADEHVVERGETLWSLAEQYLGAGAATPNWRT